MPVRALADTPILLDLFQAPLKINEHELREGIQAQINFEGIRLAALQINTHEILTRSDSLQKGTRRARRAGEKSQLSVNIRDMFLQLCYGAKKDTNFLGHFWLGIFIQDNLPVNLKQKV